VGGAYVKVRPIGRHNLTGRRVLVKVRPIGGHQATVQVSGRGLGQGHTSNRTLADIQGHGTSQWLLMTHRFKGIFHRLGPRNFPSSAAAMTSNFPQNNGRSLCLALPILNTDRGAGQRAGPKPSQSSRRA